MKAVRAWACREGFRKAFCKPRCADGDVKLESDNWPKVLGFDFCLRGIAVEKETANDREVLVISKDHVALCSLNRAMTVALAGSREIIRQ